MTGLHEYMSSNFSDVETDDAYLYVIQDGTEDPTYNCFAFAAGITAGEEARKILPDTWDKLDNAYAELGYFALEQEELENNPEDNDIEIYAKPSDKHRPLHAHKVTNAALGECESKMGEDCIIEHDRNLLQVTKPNSSQYTFGTVVARYRYDEAQHTGWKKKAVIVTKSGRKIKGRDTTTTTSGRPIKKTEAKTTKSGRVVKKKEQTSKPSGKTRA